MFTSESVRKNIIKLAKLDQDFRKKLFRKDHVPTHLERDKLLCIDNDSSAYIRTVLREFGLPTISKVGRKASYFSWLLVQHSRDIELQKKYLQLLKLANVDDIVPENMAYLQDSILVKENKPQLYGTQVKFNSSINSWEPYPIEQPNDVDKRRKSVGLETMEEYLSGFGQR